jgi:hypothetical protein
VRRLAEEAIRGGADVAVLVDVLERLDHLVGDHRRIARGEQRIDADLGRLEVEVVDGALGGITDSALSARSDFGSSTIRAQPGSRASLATVRHIAAVLPVPWPPIRPSPAARSSGRMPTGRCSSRRRACPSARLTEPDAGARGSGERARPGSLSVGLGSCHNAASSGEESTPRRQEGSGSPTLRCSHRAWRGPEPYGRM